MAKSKNSVDVDVNVKGKGTKKDYPRDEKSGEAN